MKRFFEWFRVCVPVLCAIAVLLVIQIRAQALTLEVEHTAATCAEDMVFTMSSDGTDQCVYALNSVTRAYPEDNAAPVLMVDPSQGQYRMTYSSGNTVKFRFRCSGTYNLRFYVMDKGSLPYTTARKDVTIVIDEAEYPSAEAIAMSVVTECLNAGCTTEYEKALWLHDWLIHNSAYDSTYTYCSAEAALTKNRGTCESYHRAYEMLLKRAGIETSRVVGNGHVWTGVKIDGEWTQIDVTWDDMGDSYIGTFWEHLYFGLTDDLMKIAHSDHTVDPSRPCTSLDNSYFIRSGDVSRWTDPLIATLENGIGAVRTAELSERHPPSTMQLITPIIAYALSRRMISGMPVMGVQTQLTALSTASTKAEFTVTLPEISYTDIETVIDDEAFADTALVFIRIPPGITAIGSRAFADSALEEIYIPSDIIAIADDAFEGITSLTVSCESGSFAEAFAKAHGYTVKAP